MYNNAVNVAPSDHITVRVNPRKPPTPNHQLLSPQPLRKSDKTTGGSFISFSSFDAVATDYLLDDQRWTLQRKKIGLPRKTIKTETKITCNERKIKESHKFYTEHFKRYKYTLAN